MARLRRAPVRARSPRRQPPPSSTAPAAHAELLSFRDLPAWMQDNPFIETHYRPPQPTLYRTLSSAFLQLHNESVNIYSHLLGALLFLRALLHLLPSLLVHAPPVSSPAYPVYAALRLRGAAAIAATPATAAALRGEAARALAPLVVAALYCLGTSALCHAAWVRSPRAAAVLQRADFCGIALLCAGHTLSGVRAMFYCDPRRDAWTGAVRVYSSVAAVAAVCTARCVLQPGFGGRRAHLARSVAFSALGAVCFAPVVHAGFAHGWRDGEFVWMAAWVGAATLCYVLAVAFYASRVPECCRPGKYDLWCSSHNIMHLLVVAGAWTHYRGVQKVLEHRRVFGCAASALVRG